MFRKNFLTGVWALEKVTFKVGMVCERLNIFIFLSGGKRSVNEKWSVND